MSERRRGRVDPLAPAPAEDVVLRVLGSLDSDDMAASRCAELGLPRERAAALGVSAVEAAETGRYDAGDGRVVDWSGEVAAALAAKVSIPPSAALPESGVGVVAETRVQVTNETTLGAARRLVEGGGRPLALNFANGVYPGGGFLGGARAQEEVLCRSSALYPTLAGDDMYEVHARVSAPDASSWAILSPDVPVFRNDAGDAFDAVWKLSFLTCAAPYAPAVGQPRSADLLRERIHRVLSIARAFGYSELVLGAWGCGAFRNDVHQTATDFRQALDGPFDGVFEDVIFAIADWSTERRYLGPFRDVFAA